MKNTLMQLKTRFGTTSQNQTARKFHFGDIKTAKLQWQECCVKPS